jgi:hypothetical protein
MQIENTFGRKTVGQAQALRGPAPTTPRGSAQGGSPMGASRDELAMSDLGRTMASGSRGLEDATAVRPDKVAAFRHIVEGELSLPGSVIDHIMERLADA